jgi:hypothetical protein
MKATQLERRQYRLAAARRDVPELLTWAGGLTLGFGIVNYFAMPEESAWPSISSSGPPSSCSRGSSAPPGYRTP